MRAWREACEPRRLMWYRTLGLFGLCIVFGACDGGGGGGQGGQGGETTTQGGGGAANTGGQNTGGQNAGGDNTGGTAGAQAQGGDNAGKGMFADPCTDTVGSYDCADGLVCFDFNAKGPHCTKTCMGAADCPSPPSSGCNGMGYCKID